MDEQKYPKLETTCRSIFQQSRQILSWGWDDRFQAALLQFPVTAKDAVLSMLNSHFDAHWGSSNIDKAPEVVQVVCDNLGGIRDDQLLFATDTSQDALILAAYWPWQNGQTISIRILLAVPQLADADFDKLLNRFKTWFCD